MWIIDTYPWVKSSVNSDPDWPNLLHMRPEDVGFDSSSLATGAVTGKQANNGPQSDVEGDPLVSAAFKIFYSKSDNS